MARPKTYTDDLRTQLIEDAAARIAEDGLRSLSLRSLAAEAGTSTTAIYSLFGDKDALLLAVLTHAFEQFGNSQREAAGDKQGVEALYALGRAYLEWALANPQLYTVMFGQLVAMQGEGSAELGLEAKTAMEPLLAAVASAQQRSELRSAPLDEVATSFWAYVHGIVSLQLLGLVPPDAPVDQEAVLRGWLATR